MLRVLQSLISQQSYFVMPPKFQPPHPTGIKLYCLADAAWGYVVDMYLYTGVRARLRCYGTAAGNFDAKNIMKLWASLLPEGTVLCADSFFGSQWQFQRQQQRQHGRNAQNAQHTQNA